MANYNSTWKGSQIDLAIGVIINSGVSAAELTVLKGATAGVALASKVLILNSNKNISGINDLSSTILAAQYLRLQDNTEDPATSPPTGYLFVYMKNKALYYKDSGGNVAKIGAGREKVFAFSNTTNVTCQHEFDKKYPDVKVVGTNDMPLEGQVYYQDQNTLIVSFNHNQTGQVICSTSV